MSTLPILARARRAIARTYSLLACVAAAVLPPVGWALARAFSLVVFAGLAVLMTRLVPGVGLLLIASGLVWLALVVSLVRRGRGLNRALVAMAVTLPAAAAIASLTLWLAPEELSPYVAWAIHLLVTALVALLMLKAVPEFIHRRLVASASALLVIVVLSFLIMRLVPGGPFIQEKGVHPKILEHLNRKYHLDEPLWRQGARYLGDLARGDLGPSLKRPDRTVNDILAQAFPKSALLGATALLVALLAGGSAGVYAALHHNTARDYAAMGLVMIGISIPSMVLAPLLITFFALTLKLLPTSGWGGFSHIVLPATALGLAYAARIARLTRGGMLEVIRQDFIRTARAKGLSERIVIWRHALRLGLSPLVSYLGPATASILTGSFVVEKIFAIPGMGTYFISAATERDYTLALGTVLVYSTLLVVLNLLVDITQAILDPRVRLE